MLKPGTKLIGKNCRLCGESKWVLTTLAPQRVYRRSALISLGVGVTKQECQYVKVERACGHTLLLYPGTILLTPDLIKESYLIYSYKLT